MNLLKPLIMSMMIVCMVTLMGCSKEAPKTEEIPYVMVTQPSTTLHEQKAMLEMYRLDNKLPWHFGWVDKLRLAMWM